MHSTVLWTLPADPTKYVKEVLAKEAAEIPEEKINQGKWVLAEINYTDIRVNDEMIVLHDLDPQHIERRNNFIKMIEEGKPILPLIILGKDLLLVDGYARYRALKELGIESIEVILQEFN
jgi:hypothetical protein